MKKIKTLILLVIIVITTVPTKSLTSQSLQKPSYPSMEIFYDSICKKIIERKIFFIDMAKYNSNIFKKIFSKKVRISSCDFDTKDPGNFKIIFTWKNRGKNTLIINGPNYKNPYPYRDKKELPGIIFDSSTILTTQSSHRYHRYKENQFESIYDINLILVTLDVLTESWIYIPGEIGPVWAAICQDKEFFKEHKRMFGKK